MSAPKLYGCSPLDRYQLNEKLGEGTFGHVHKGVFKPTNSAVALKQIILHDSSDGMPITSLREIKIMKTLRHQNILHLLDVAVEKKRDPAENRKTYSFYMVMSYMDHDLCGLLHNRDISFTIPIIKLYMEQILKGVAYLHENQYMHRDIKSANILVSNDGTVKVADFGLARRFVEPKPTLTSTSEAVRRYTPKVVTRWYRPPELLLGEVQYTPAIDMWGVGCIFGEIFKRGVLLPGNSDLDQINRIFRLVGSPDDHSMPGFTKLPFTKNLLPIPNQPNTIQSEFSSVPQDAVDLMEKMLLLNPMKRITASGALEHKFFTTGAAAAKLNSLPIYPASREMDVHKKRRNPSPQPQLNDKRRKFDNNRKRRAFEARIPNKRELAPAERVPPYKKGLNY